MSTTDDATLVRGDSELAKEIAAQLSQHLRHLHKAAFAGSSSVVRGELAEVWQDCQTPNWDGYDAAPVNAESYANAKRLLLSLPLGTPLPTAGAIPNGNVTLDWYHSRRRNLTISLSPDGDLHYAALLGAGRQSGTLPFFGEIPQDVLDLIRRVFAC